MSMGSRASGATARLAVSLVLFLSACQSSATPNSIAPSRAVLPTSSGQAQPSITPSASVAATAAPTSTTLPATIARPTDVPTDGACKAPHDCLGLLGPGSYHTRIFKPGFGFKVAAAGWENLADEGGVFGLLPISSPGDAILFFRQPKATSPDGTPVFSVDISVDAIAKWLAANPALSVGTQATVTIGGLKGVRMDVAIAPDAGPSLNCPVRTCVSIFKGVDPGAVKIWQWDWSAATSERQRLYLLTAAGAGVIAIFVDSLDGTTFDALTASADTILATVRFDKP